MKISKAMSIAAVVTMASVHWPAVASGNAHKYPVVPKEVLATPAVAVPTKAEAGVKPADSVVIQPAEAAVTKPSAAANTQPAATAAAVPAGSVSSKPTEVSGASLTERLVSNIVIVSRYEPLSGRDSLEAVPDLNRGRGKGK